MDVLHEYFAQLASRVNGAKRPREKRGEFARAVDWLEKQLEGGKVFSVAIRQGAQKLAISDSTLRRAFRKLGCKAGKDSEARKWHWHLPTPAPHEAAAGSNQVAQQ